MAQFKLGHTFPLVEESSSLYSSRCLASFTETRQEWEAQLLFGANNVPLPVHLSTPQTKSLLEPSHTRFCS